MLDFADLVAINKFDKPGSRGRLRDVRKQYRRNHRQAAHTPDAQVPIFPTIAALQRPGHEPPLHRGPRPIAKKIGRAPVVARPGPLRLTARTPAHAGLAHPLPRRDRRGREAHARIEAQVEAARRAWVYESLKALQTLRSPEGLRALPGRGAAGSGCGCHAACTARRLEPAGSMRWAPRPWRSSRAGRRAARSATEQTYSYKVREQGHRPEPSPRACRAPRAQGSRSRT